LSRLRLVWEGAAHIDEMVTGPLLGDADGIASFSTAALSD
jgi:hypothetical protein